MIRASGRLKTRQTTIPRTPLRRATRRKTPRVRATAPALPDAAASAIWRTPLLPIPRPVTVPMRPVAEVKSPTRPIPAGPSNTANTFIRTIPMRMWRICPPPTSEVDVTICR